MPTMNISLPEDLERFIAEQLRDGGGYGSQSEVVRDALRLLRARSDKLRRLNGQLDAGLAAAEQGRTKPLTSKLLTDIADRRKKQTAKGRPTKN